MAIKGLQPLEAPEFLKCMAHDLPGLYILGSFNRHITVHSQQCRAVNLIQALMKEVGIEDKSVAIVGAGFAGLTAAAFALEKTTAQVTLFDAAPRPLWLQDACSNRWLHPGIYDWPRPGSLEPRTNLPVLNWRSGTARDVARQVRSEWDRIAATKAALKVKLESKITGVEQDGAKLVLVIGGDTKEPFDIVVLAVGFGVEEGEPNQVGYWNDADGLDGIADGAKVLISGFGDGGLADVLRLCLPSIRQANLVELVRNVPDPVCQKLLDQENALQKDPAALHEFYRELEPVDDIVKRLKSAAAPLARVRLTGKTQYVYGTGSAILNRFLVAHLRHVRTTEEFDVRAPIAEVKEENGKTSIKFQDEDAKREEFDHVLYRWGPKAAFDRIGSMSGWEKAGFWRQHWRGMPQSMDDTRVLADGSGPEGASSELVSKMLASESSSRKWCLILRPDDKASDEWEVHMRLAMEECETTTPLNIEPIEVKTSDIFSDHLPMHALVRALCAADIVLADLTGYDPTILMLLGIRAAVRRSITIPCTLDESIDKIWKELPFNLRELNVVFGTKKVRGEILKKTVAAALAQSGALSRYLDLPVYDYVRQDTFEETAGEAQPILLLRAFQNYEGSGRLNTVETGIRKAFGLGGDARVESVIDQQSPRLAGQRLYEAIRHWRRCVVDVTWWRANVMFELGVRLATHPQGTFCLLDETVVAAGPVGSVKLKEFLALKGYDLKAYGFDHKFKTEAAGFGVIHNTAAQHFRTAQDGYDHLVDAELVAEAEATQRKNAQEQVDIAPLYGSKNTAFGNVILSSALEKRCAAWCYLVERERPHELRPIDLLDERCADSFRRFRRLSSRLKLDLARGARDVHMRERIAEAEKVAAGSGATAMADLLELWARIRAEPPWLEEPSNCDAWQDDADQLKILGSTLGGVEQSGMPVGVAGRAVRPKANRRHGGAPEGEREMIQELTESVDQLRDEAQAARKAARQSADPAEREQLFASAREKFKSAIRRLERGLRNVRRDQKEHSSDACAVLERLSQTYGSLGGTLRDFALTKADPERQKMLAEARSQYEQGNTYEDERRKHCGALDTYNMLQLLVVQLLGHAPLIDDDDFETKLQGVQNELKRQVNAGRNDSWAFADLALVSFLLGSPADHALADIEQRNVHASFYEATHTVITNLLNEGLGGGGDLTKRLEEFQRLLKRKGGLA